MLTTIIRPFLQSMLLVALIAAAAAEEAKEPAQESESPPPDPTEWNTHMFDNARFFTPFTEGGLESGIDGWVRITVKGYREYIQRIEPRRCALIVVDLNAGRQPFSQSDWCRRIAELDAEQAANWGDQMDNVLLPNVEKLVTMFREKKMMVVYLGIGGAPQPTGFHPSIAPKPGDRRIAKFSSGAFASSALDNLLREHGITTLFFVGHDTPCCVSQTMAGAYDRSYQTILVSDATYSSVPGLHEATVKIWAYKAFVRTTEQVLSDYPWQSWIDPGLREFEEGKGK